MKSISWPVNRYPNLQILAIGFRKQMNPDRLLRVIVLAILGSITVSGLVYHLFNVDILDLMPGTTICIFHLITDLPCPGCGMGRALIYLGQLKVIEAVSSNLFSLPLAGCMVTYCIHGRAPALFKRPPIIWSLLILVIIFGIWRIVHALPVMS